MRDLIEERCGLRFDDSQRTSLSASVAARMEQLALDSELEYYERLQGGTPHIVETELRNLLNLVTVTETCFFRDASQFRLLRGHIVPSLLGGGSRRIRIWSAGCSSGEEAYSIALTLEDMGLSHTHPDWTITIVGTDLNSNVLESAQRGVYSERAVRHVEGRLLDRFFVRDGKTFELRSEIRDRVTFEFGNLRQTPMPSAGPQDVIFCKNVAIYFRTEVTQKLIRGLHETLSPGGYLLLGHAESLWQMSDGFTLVEDEGAFCYRKAVAPPSAVARSFSVAQGASVAQVTPVAQGFSPVRAGETTAQYDACLAAFRAGDWATAESGLVALIASCPTFVPAHLLLGGVYAHRARYDEAQAQAEAVLRLSDLEARAHLLVGMVAARRLRWDDALQSLRRALYLDDSLALAHFWLGNLYRDRGDIARACHEYENVVLDWERHTLELTEEFASDLTATQIVEFCSDSLQRLQGIGANG